MITYGLAAIRLLCALSLALYGALEQSKLNAEAKPANQGIALT